MTIPKLRLIKGGKKGRDRDPNDRRPSKEDIERLRQEISEKFAKAGRRSFRPTQEEIEQASRYFIDKRNNIT